MFYTIAQAAERCGLTAHTLRYYDKEGLLPFVERTAGGIRMFSENDLEGLAIITCLKNTGMPVKDIKIFMDWCMLGDETIRQRYEMFVNQKKKIQEQIDAMNKYMEKIDFKIWYYKTALDAGTLDVHKNTCPHEQWVKQHKR